MCERLAIIICQPFKHLIMRGSKKLLFLTALLPLALLTKANTIDDGKAEPVLQGYVSDAVTKKPVQGVTISISTKGQEKSDKKELTTDAYGNFKIPQLPNGEVVIILEKKGYKTCRREGVVIKEGVSLKLNFDIVNMTANDDDESGVFHPLMRMVEG